MMFVSMVFGVSLLLAHSAMAYVGSSGFALVKQRSARLSPMYSSVMSPLGTSSIESTQRKMISTTKVQPTVVVEERRISVIAVPSLREIEDAAKGSERSIASKTFCSRSGGYPDLDVKDGIYLLLWASMTHNLHQEQALSQQDTL